jgi:hypothetical protein
MHKDAARSIAGWVNQPFRRCESGDPEIFPDFDWGIELER